MPIGTGADRPGGPWPANQTAVRGASGASGEVVGVLTRVVTFGGLPVAAAVLSVEVALGGWMAYGFSQDTPSWSGVVLAAVLALAGPVSAIVRYRRTDRINRVGRLCRAETVGILIGLLAVVLLLLWLGAITVT